MSYSQTNADVLGMGNPAQRPFVPIANVDLLSDALVEQTTRVAVAASGLSVIADRLFGFWPEATPQKDTSGGDDIASRLRALSEAVDALSLQLSRFG